MARVVTQLDLDLQQMKLKTEEAKAQFRSLAQQAKETNIGENLFGKLSGAAGALGLSVGVGATIAGLKSIAKHYDDISDAADKMGESADVIQRVGFAASQSGSSIEGVSNSFIKLEKALGDVENSAARDALAHFGVTAESLAAMPLDQKLVTLAGAFEKARATGTGVSDLMTLLGKNAAELIPLLSQGKDGIENMLESAPVLASEAVDSLSELNDALDELGAKATMTGGKVAVGLGMMASIALNTLTTSMTLDQAIDAEADKMNERSGKSARRRKRPTIAANTDAAASSAAQTKSDNIWDQYVKADHAVGVAGMDEAQKLVDLEDQRLKLDERITAADNNDEKLKLMTEQAKIMERMVTMQQAMAKAAAAEEEQRQKSITELQGKHEKDRISALPPAEQAKAIAANMADILKQVSPNDPTRAGLDKAIENAPNSAAKEDLMKKRDKLDEDQKALKALAPKEDATQYQQLGAFGKAGAFLSGGNPNELIAVQAEKTQENTAEAAKTLTIIKETLARIEGKDSKLSVRQSTTFD